MSKPAKLSRSWTHETTLPSGTPRARRDTAKTEYDRSTKLFEKNAGPEKQVSRSKGYLEITQAEFDVAEKALQDTELRAPFGGRIARRLVDDFANVRLKQPVLVLQDESSLELRVAVAERDWARGETGIARDELTRRINPRVEIASLRGRFFPACPPSAIPKKRCSSCEQLETRLL